MAAQRRIPTLVTPRLILRPPSPADLADLTALFGDADAMHFVGQGKTFPPVQVAHMLETMLSEARHGSAHPDWMPGVPGGLVMIESGTQEFVGMSVLRMLAPDLAAAVGDTPKPAIEAGYILGKDFWGKGLATEAAQALVRYGVGLAGKERVIAVADVKNTASHHVLEKAGFGLVKEFDYREMRMNYWVLN
jgi:RimJ/RimL family protein N-acetyltransferase